MIIVADEEIPFVNEYFGSYGTVILKPGRELAREDVQTADILLIRSVTKVDRALLEGTPVKFVGSVVTGIDHLDTEWLDAAGIRWAAAPGSNTTAVVEYMVALVAVLQKMEIFPIERLRAGVIGIGRVGSEVVEALELLNFDVIQHDPIRAENEKDFVSTSLEEFSNLDLITLHTPLTRDGEYPTYHLINRDFILRQKKNCVLVNAARGAVVDTSDLKEYGETLYWCLDVWEDEPNIDFQALELSLIATPHIAGHTNQAKQRGVDMVYRAAQEQKILPAHDAPIIEFQRHQVFFANAEIDWRDAVLKIYDPRFTTRILKNEVLENGNAKIFDTLRSEFKQRYEFGYVKLCDLRISEADMALLKQIGFEKFY